nr:VP1 [Mute swan feces associated ambidensovirus 3]
MANPKYPVLQDPRLNPAYPKQRDGESIQAYRNRVRYVWQVWNTARQNRGLRRVFPPPDVGLTVTARPNILRGSANRRTNDADSYLSFLNNPAQREPTLDTDGNIITQIAANDPTPMDIQEFETSTRQVADLGGGVGYEGVASSQIIPNIPEARLQIEVPPHSLFKQSKMSLVDFINDDNIDADDIDELIDNSPSSESDSTPSMSGNPSKRFRPNEGAGPSGMQTSTTTAAPVPMDTSTQGTGHTAAADGGFDSAQGPMSVLPKGGYSVSPGSMTIRKVHRMKSWGTPYTKITDANFRSGSNLVVTPLVEIPVDRPALYMTPQEFQTIPAGSRIKRCRVDVAQITCSTGYPTGGTESSTAVTNHPKILCVGHDLMQKCRGGTNRWINIADSMIPQSISGKSFIEDFAAQQYGTDQTAADVDVVIPGAAHSIPYINYNHFCIYQPNNAQAIARGFTAENAPGWEVFQHMITEQNANDTTYSHIASHSHTFSSAPIGEQYTAQEILTDGFDQAIGSAQYYNMIRELTGTSISGGTNILSESITPSRSNVIPPVTYFGLMEQGACMTRGDAPNKPARQPTLHVGIRAIDKSTPSAASSRASEFVQAQGEFLVSTMIEIALPSYPNRFTNHKRFNTSIENFVAGIGRYPNPNIDRFVTFGLYDTTQTAPTLDAVDAVTAVVQNEDGSTTTTSVLPHRRTPRALPSRKAKKKPRSTTTINK